MKSNLWNIDLGFFLPVSILIILSLATLFSVSFDLFRNQVIFLIISIIAFLFFSQVNYKAVQTYAVPIYIVSVVLLLLVLALGIESRGAVRWIEILGFRIQFSEVLKPFLSISLASFLVAKNNSSFKSMFLTLVFLFIISLLIFLQPDLGSAIIYILVTILVLIFFGFPVKFFMAGFLFLAAISPIFLRLLHDYQRQRLIAYINPAKDPLGSSYNAIQSIIAVGSGMLLGKGLGQGTQSGLYFLPERHTDFIFATISEQLGFVGSVLIIAAFVFLLYKIFTIFTNCDDSFCKVFTSVCFFIILVQFFMNIGMNIGLLPVVGVTLPFVSYGGSSLLSNFILLGLLSSVSKSTKEKQVLEIK